MDSHAVSILSCYNRCNTSIDTRWRVLRTNKPISSQNCGRSYDRLFYLHVTYSQFMFLYQTRSMSVEPVRLNEFYLPIYDWLNFVKFEEVPKEESYNHGVLLWPWGSSLLYGQKIANLLFVSSKFLALLICV